MGNPLIFRWLQERVFRRPGRCCSGLLQKGLMVVVNTVAVELGGGALSANRKPHGMGAEEQLAVFDRMKGMKADVGRNLGRSPAVPTRAMALFRLDGHFAC